MTPPAQAYREIPLTQGKVALVDEADYADLARFKWFAHLDKSTGNFYAARLETTNIRRTAGRAAGKLRQRYISMHRYLMGFPDPKKSKVDHRDRNGLHNYRSNLRVATNVQNGANSRRQSHNTTGFKGVTFRKDRSHRSDPWQAYIVHEQQQIFLGFHATAEDAARTYDAKASQLRGEFASLNFPLEAA